VTVKRAVFVALALVAVGLTTAGCERPRLREDYMGKRLLQPDKMPAEVERDATGDPILD